MTDHLALHAPTVPRSTSRRALAGLAGFVIGLLVGVVVDAAAWIFAFASALNGSGSVHVPLIVDVTTTGSDVSAQSGAGVLLIPVLLAVVGLVVAVLLSRRHRPEDTGR